MSRTKKKYSYLFAPGPIRIPNEIKKALLNDPPYFASNEFSSLLERIQPKLSHVFTMGHGPTHYPVLIGTGSGSLAMEASVSNFFRYGDTVVVVNTGKYGGNWEEMCSAYGLEVIPIRCKPGASVSMIAVANAFRACSYIRGIFVTHAETTTGVLNDVDGICKVVRDMSPDTLVIVDAVCSLLTEPLLSHDFDVVISASQKALSLPPGLFFMGISNDALHAAERSNLPKFYFDVPEEYRRNRDHITRFTPATTLIAALDVALDEILKRDVRNIVFSTRDIANTIREVLYPIFGGELFPTYPASALTVVKYDESDELIRRLKSRHDIIIGDGVRELKGQVCRVMHFGWELSLDELLFVVRKMNEEAIEINRSSVGR